MHGHYCRILFKTLHRVLIKGMINWCIVHYNEYYVNDLTPFSSSFPSSLFFIPFSLFNLFNPPLVTLLSLSTLTVSAGHLPQVPSRSDSHSGSLPHWHEEGASVGSHRHDSAVRPLRAGGQKAKNRQEENPRYGSVRTRRNHKNMHWTSTHSRKYAYCRQLVSFFLDNNTMCSVYFIFLCLSVLTLCLWLWVNQVKAKKTKKTTGTGPWLVVCCTSSAHTVSFLISVESSSCFPRIWMINKSNLRLFPFDVLVSGRLTR